MYKLFSVPPREPNNHTAKKADEWRKLAHAVVHAYGHRYQRAADYLIDLANNQFWVDAEIPHLDLRNQDPHHPAAGEPRYIMHDSLINALAPAVPLRAVWQGNRYR